MVLTNDAVMVRDRGRSSANNGQTLPRLQRIWIYYQHKTNVMGQEVIVQPRTKFRRLRWLGHVLRMPKESCPKMDATRKKEARTTKDNMAEHTNGRATRYGALVGRGSGHS